MGKRIKTDNGRLGGFVTERYPEGDWPDWFRNVVDKADGLLRTHFRHGIDPMHQRTIMEMIDPSPETPDYPWLVSRFEEAVRKAMER